MIYIQYIVAFGVFVRVNLILHLFFLGDPGFIMSCTRLVRLNP